MAIEYYYACTAGTHIHKASYASQGWGREVNPEISV